VSKPDPKGSWREEGASGANTGATFKWSRDNGSVVFPIGSLTGRLVTLEHLGRDDRLGLQVGDLVEVMNDDYALRGSAGTLLEVEEIDTGNLRVTLNAAPDPALGEDTTKHPLLRRWDHGSSGARDDELELQGGAIPLEEGVWIDLEDGVQVLFQPATDEGTPNAYRAGDYWLIPARTATGDVEWPGKWASRRPGRRTAWSIITRRWWWSIRPNPPEIDCRCTFYPSCYYSLDR
jgi:hypothetical protein